MKEVTTSEFRKKIYQYLNELPITIVKYRERKPVAVVVKPEGYVEKPQEATPQVIRKVAKAQGVELCKHGFQKGLCKYGC